MRATEPAPAPTPAERRGVDRRLILAAVLFGLAAGNHSLTLLLVPPVGLYVLAVEPGIWRRLAVRAHVRRARSWPRSCSSTSSCRSAAGSCRRSLIYGRPATWDGFWYIALAEQFRGSLSDPFADLATKVDQVVALASAQLGLLALAIPPAFVVAAWRAPRFTLLTGLALRHHRAVQPGLRERGHRALLPRAGAVGLAVDRDPGRRARRRGDRSWSAALAARLSRPAPLDADAAAPSLGAPGSLRSSSASLLLLPTLGDLDARRHAADRSKDTGAQAWLAQALPGRGAGRRARQLVEHLDAAVVRPEGRGAATRHRRHRRPDDARPGPRPGAGRDQPLPWHPAGLRDPPGRVATPTSSRASST